MSWFSPHWLRRQEIVTDLAIGLVLTIYLMSATTLSNNETTADLLRDIAEGCGVAMRRVWTIVAFFVVTAATLFNDLATWPYPLGLAIILYTMADSDFPRWACWVGAAVSVVVLLLPWPSQIDLAPNVLTYLIPEIILFTVAPVLTGLYSRARRTLLQTYAERSADEERARRLEAERIRADERNRLANEIHDVVAHRVSLMVVHSGALKLAAADERTRETAETVRSLGRMALEELREVVGVLRSDESAPLAPTANLANLEALLGDSRKAGDDVTFHQAGTPRKLAATVERTAYRVVQESLTNARKHAPGAAIMVQLVWGTSTLDVTVINEAPARDTAVFPQSGHGLKSLRERTALVSGRIEAGPMAGGGWAVRATLPYGTAEMRGVSK
ncbi:sensor histidine kinase [Catelliglobosispora koreensis]|uniref:sensor histidine kinase n=1 Tax=Catelliglobosispora koreensis TaxID=129052 RepID=UPI000369FC62|nr:histidine kinase [Catelliglobosispora koreensis]